jgi:transposase InsO family protein
MDEQKAFYTVCLMSRVLEVSRAGFYKWKNCSITQTEKRRKMLKTAVFEIYHMFKKRYGAPRMTRELNELGISCSLNHVALLMQELGLKAHNGKNFKYSPAGFAVGNISENLLKRRFNAEKPNQKWVTDITYINANGKWIYLAVVMDLYSRAIVGWSVDTHMRETLICNALDMAFARRNIPENLVVHSDRGVQYRSNAYIDKLLDNGCKISMSRKANCWDNAVVESFFSRFKVECIYPNRFKSLDQAKTDIFEYIEIFYNRKRRHSAIGYISPMQYEQLINN